MANLGQEFDVNSLPASEGGDFPLVPAGWYDATIKKSELKEWSETEKDINFQFAITGPSHQGRIVFGKVTLRNPDPEKEGKGRAALGELMRATNIARVVDSDQFTGQRCMIKVTVTKGGEYQGKNYEPKNAVYNFKAITGSTAPAFTPAPAAQATASAAPPWARK